MRVDGGESDQEQPSRAQRKLIKSINNETRVIIIFLSLAPTLFSAEQLFLTFLSFEISTRKLARVIVFRDQYYKLTPESRLTQNASQSPYIIKLLFEIGLRLPHIHTRQFKHCTTYICIKCK